MNKLNKTLTLIAVGTFFTSNACIISAHADGNEINSSTNKSTAKSTYIKLDCEDGSINNAVAFAENKFYINGNIVNGTENNYYFLNDNFTLIDNFSDFDVSIYGKNYLSAENDKYYLNLQTGGITEDDIQKNNLLDAEVNLRKKIRKSAKNRYSDYSEAKSLNELTNYKFNDTWYETKYYSNNTTNGSDSNTPLIVYTDIQGNYIDADYNLGKIKVVTTNKTISITNTDKINKKTSIAISNQNTIGHDSLNIYRTATLTITSDEAIQKINGLSISNIDGSAFRISDNGQTVSFDVIQKLSKEQSDDDIDGAKYSKNVSTYILSKDTGRKVSISANSKYSISKGKIISYSVSDDNKISASTITLKTSKGYNFIGNKKISAETFDDYDIDASGGLWILRDGFIYRYSTKEWVKTHKVDGLMNNLSIYDSNNFIVWNTNSERYTIYNNTPKNNLENTNELNKSQYGWIQNQDGTWSFILEDSTKKTGWLLDNSKWYYLDSDGIMKTGWLNTNGKWYYLDNNGSMLSNTTINGYVLSNSGEWIN